MISSKDPPGTSSGNMRIRSVEYKPSTTGLGDRTEATLKKLGITQDKYKEAKEKFGFAPECNCPGRIRWLNRVGEYFGIK